MPEVGTRVAGRVHSRLCRPPTAPTVASGTLPRGATGTVCGMPSGSGEVGAGTYTSVSGITGAAGVNGLAEPAAAVPADAAAVVSGTLPRGATGDVCGGLSGPGRTLAANNWVASAASSAALIGRSLSASTDRYSLVLMELVHGRAVEHGQRVVGEHGQRRVQRHQVRRDRRPVDPGEPHRQPRRLLADQARLEQARPRPDVPRRCGPG